MLLIRGWVYVSLWWQVWGLNEILVWSINGGSLVYPVQWTAVKVPLSCRHWVAVVDMTGLISGLWGPYTQTLKQENMMPCDRWNGSSTNRSWGSFLCLLTPVSQALCMLPVSSRYSTNTCWKVKYDKKKTERRPSVGYKGMLTRGREYNNPVKRKWVSLEK